MKQYKPSIMNSLIAGILVFGIVAACIAAGYGISSHKAAPSVPEAAVLEI